MSEIKKVVLAYSGGLDTSVILKWLQDEYQCEVVTFTADIGQGEELEPARAKALKFGIKPEQFENRTIHIHVPSGAIPKDGPSAGVTMVTALVSLLTGKAARRNVAMTGEITLTGRVLAIGGLKEKVLAAHRAGVSTVVAPERNRDDLEDIPEKVRNDLQFIFISEAAEALAVAL